MNRRQKGNLTRYHGKNMKNNLIKKLISFSLVFFTALAGINAEMVYIDKLGGLQRNPKADRIEDGSHFVFTNFYIEDGNIQNVKGRDRLNSTAHTDTVVNGIWYYEKQDGSVKKLVVAESDELVTYNTDGTSRTQIANTLTNEGWDAVQIGDVLYLTSSTNGLYKWTGTGSATLVGTASSPSGPSFSATTGNGGLTSGLPAIVIHEFTADTTNYFRQGGLCIKGVTYVADAVEDNTACGSLSSDFTKTCATTSTYQYKFTQFSSISGIESEATSAATATLTGANTVSVAGRNCARRFSDSGCTTDVGANDCQDTIISITGEQTRTTGSVPTATAPYDMYRIYRTTAGGSDFFLVGQQNGGTFTDGKPDVALSTPLDTTIDTIAPPSFRYIEEYKGSIFVAEGDTIKFTRVPVGLVTDADTYWLDTDELQITGNITGMIKASDSLLIFTTKSIYQLTGYGVDSFRLIPIIQGTGAISSDTIKVDTNGDVLFFSGTSGVYKLRIGQQPSDSLGGPIVNQNNAVLTKVSGPNLDNVFRGEDSVISLTPSTYSSSHAYYDSDNDYYYLYINDKSFLFNATNSTWSYIPATHMIGSVWVKSPSAAGQGILVDNLGFFYKNWIGFENGVESGTVTGNPTSSTSNTLVCSTCTFNTTNDGLKGVWVFLDNDFNEFRQITSNTATSITVSSNWSQNPIAADKFYIGYIMSELTTKQYSFVKPPDEAKTMLLFINHNKPSTSQLLTVESFQDKSSTPVNAFTIDLSERFIHSINTRMRSSWSQWRFRSLIYSTSTSIDSPVDIVSYIVDTDAEKRLNYNNG